MLPDSTTPSESVPTCAVCGLPGNGINFGVHACKACAAFFRRAILAKKRNPNCKNSTNKCEPDVEKKWSCKRCRLDRCISVGMISERVQADRDLVSSVENYHMDQRKKKFEVLRVLPQTMETFLGRPHFLITFEPEKAAPVKYVIDASSLLNHAMRMFMTPPKLDEKLGTMNGLQRLAYGLNQLRKAQKSEVTTMTSLSRDTSLWFFEHDFGTVARWLSYLEDFNKIEFDTQMKILKSCWLIWTRLERTSMTAEMRGKKVIEDKIFINSHETAISLDEFEVDCDWYTNYSKQQMKYFMDFLEADYLEDLLKPLIEQQPTEMELAFMMSQLCFQIAGKSLGSEVSEITDKLIDQMADGLHEYYTEDQKTPRYSHRLTTLLNISRSFEKFSMMRREKMAIGHVFDVFKVQFSDPDFHDSVY